MLFTVCALSTLIGSVFIGHLAVECLRQDVESHTAGWSQAGADALIVLGCLCAVATSLHSLAHIWL